MKRIVIVTVSVLVVATMVLGASAAMAAKPQDAGKNSIDVIAKSNGFPSGPHFNLNIHGKDPATFGDPEDGGHSIFVPIDGGATIQYVTNKKSSVTDLIALDANAMPAPYDDGKAIVQLPYEADGYWVFARILAKPNNGSNSDTRSNIILYPNEVKYAYNDDPNNPLPGFGDYTGPDDDLLALGVIVGPNIYTPGQDYQFYRFENPTSKGKGKSKAVDITPLFVYTGWVVHQDLDANDDGVIDINDVPEGDYDGNLLTPDNRDYNNDGSVNEDDVNAWLTDKSMEDPPMAWYFVQEWILNIADLVVTEQGLVNDGTKLLQIRFYPVDTTEYQGRGRIIIEKQTTPNGDATLFTFDADYYAMNFSLADDGTNDSGGLLPGIYDIAELVPDGWVLANIDIDDPSGGSTSIGNTATIDLAAGEIVRITFYNESQ